MTVHTRSIIGATEYILHTISDLKKSMQDFGTDKQKVAMAVGGMIVTMTSNLIAISQEVIKDAANNPQPDAKADLKLIQSRFNEFVDRMIEG